MPFEEDMFFTVESCRHEAELIPDSELRPIPTPGSHFGMLGLDPDDKDRIDETIRDLLETPI